MRYPLLLKGRHFHQQTANEFAANFRFRGTDFLWSSLAAQQGVKELDPAVLQLLYHGYLKACWLFPKPDSLFKVRYADAHQSSANLIIRGETRKRCNVPETLIFQTKDEITQQQHSQGQTHPSAGDKGTDPGTNRIHLKATFFSLFQARISRDGTSVLFGRKSAKRSLAKHGSQRRLLKTVAISGIVIVS